MKSLEGQERGHDADILALLDERMRKIAQEVLESSDGARQLPRPDRDGEEFRARLARVMAKEFVSVGEAALLLSCSDGHIRNLMRKAKKGEARCPIPFRDLDGVAVFKLDELLAWSAQPKQKPRPVK